MNTKTSNIENIIIEKVETYHIDLLSKLNKNPYNSTLHF